MRSYLSSVGRINASNLRPICRLVPRTPFFPSLRVTSLPLSHVRSFAGASHAAHNTHDDDHGHDDHDHGHHGDFLDVEEVTGRVLGLLSSVNKIEANPAALKTLSTESTFESLGLDSLDQVEVVMQLEEEFCVDLYDPDAAKIVTVKDAIEIFSNTPFAQ